ncbi:MAG: hypothetical protein IJD04_07475 [Desulfovibrionaceae bacterium]|nr:hypothetical protein [Desulfovibrionaceae bacterium]
MSFLSGSPLKTALRCILILILAMIGAGLLYSDEIGQIYRDWKTGGSSEESIAIPQPPGVDNPEINAPSPNPAPQASSGPGYGLPDPSGIFEQTVPGSHLAMSAPDELNTPASETDSDTAGRDINLQDEENVLLSEGENASATPLTSSREDASSPVSESEPVGGMEIITSSGQRVQVGGTAPLQHQDSIITRRYIYDLAGFLVNAYYPPGTHRNAVKNGYINASLLNLNVHYGADTRRHFGRARAAVLRYVLSPSMLEGLYRLYKNDFLNAMQELAGQQNRRLGGKMRKMTDSEQKRMFADYAVYTESLAALFEACAASPAIREKLDAYYDAAALAVRNNQIYIEASIAYDQAGSANSNEVKAALSQAKAAYDSSFHAREDARDALLVSLKRYPGVRALGDPNILYGAGWIKRRLADGSASSDTLSAVSRILHNLSDAMNKLATGAAGRGGA